MNFLNYFKSVVRGLMNTKWHMTSNNGNNAISYETYFRLNV